MKAYIDLLARLLTEGEPRSDRTGTGTLSLFGPQLQFNLAEGFPLLTTKKLFVKGIIYELLWFLRGETNVKWLQENGVHIWDEWADEEGELGPVYGHQWRKWMAADGREIDQISQVIQLIKTDPHGRRHIVSAWNVGEIERMALPACHILFQFYVSGTGVLSCHLYQRSADVFLGVPFNIASYALLLSLVAQVCGLTPGRLIISFGDVHLYKNHMAQAIEQSNRQPRVLPQLRLNPAITDIDAFTYADIGVANYDPWPAIKADVSK